MGNSDKPPTAHDEPHHTNHTNHTLDGRDPANGTEQPRYWRAGQGVTRLEPEGGDSWRCDEQDVEPGIEPGHRPSEWEEARLRLHALAASTPGHATEFVTLPRAMLLSLQLELQHERRHAQFMTGLVISMVLIGLAGFFTVTVWDWFHG